MFDNLLVEKYRPHTLDDIVLSKKNRRYFEGIVKKQEIPHLLFCGSPGIGKTTLAKILVKDVLNCQYLYINASDESGVDVIRDKVTRFAQTGSLDGKIKVIILDEIDGLSTVKSGSSGTSAQQALRNVIEENAKTTRFIGTCNYKAKVMEAVESRFQSFDLTPPFEEVVDRAVHVIKSENVTVAEDQKANFIKLVKNNYPDMRKVIGEIHKNIFDGKLILDDEEDRLVFAEQVFKKIVEGKISSTRKFVIDNEIKFSNNYHTLLRNLFDVVEKSTLTFGKKRPILLTIANAMGQHGIVMDVEINAYACLLEVSELLGSN